MYETIDEALSITYIDDYLRDTLLVMPIKNYDVRLDESVETDVSGATFVAEVISFCGEERYTEFIVGESVERLRFGGPGGELSIEDSSVVGDVSILHGYRE